MGKVEQPTASARHMGQWNIHTSVRYGAADGWDEHRRGYQVAQASGTFLKFE